MAKIGRVLVVDDEPTSVDVLSRFLEQDGYDVLKGYSGADALAMAGAAMPDIILLDVNMDGINGYDVTRALKNGTTACNIPILLITGMDTLDEKVKGLEAGADDFLSKPVNRIELKARMRSLLKLKQLQEGVLEQALREEKEFTDNLIQNAAAPIFVLDTSHRILIWNKACEQLTGYGAAEMIGTDRQWEPVCDSPRPTLADLIIDGRQELADRLYSDVSPSGPGGLRGEGWYTFRGGERRYVCFDAEPIYSSGKLVAAITTIRDITMRKSAEEELRKSAADLEKALAELKATQGAVIQQEKMASIGQLAAGVAHEINNPVGFIASNLNTLAKYVERYDNFIKAQSELIEALPDRVAVDGIRGKRKALKLDYILEDGRELITESLEGAERVRAIVQNLKSFSRVDDTACRDADINECITSTINIVWNELKYKASLIKELGEIPRIICFPQQLNQVFMNLLVNAVHAIEKQGEITVKSWHDGGFVHVSVADTGCGMPPAVLERIFEPFYTTKEAGKGTGLGLSITYDIVKKHNGEITVDSEPGRGTTFTVRLPVVEKKEDG